VDCSLFLRLRFAGIGLILLCVALGSDAIAEPADTRGASAHATLSVQATVPKGELAVNGQASFERRDSLVRIDLQALSLTGPSKPATTRNPLPPGGYTIVVDAATRAYTVWSPSKRTYYSGQGGGPSASVSPATPTPTASEEPSGPNLSAILASLKDLRQFAVSLSLSPDKTPIDGHPTTNFDFHFTRQIKGKDPVELLGRASFADDLGGIPLLVVLNVRGGPSSTLTAQVRVALSDVTQKVPPKSDFVPPSGYRKVSSLFDVIIIPTRTSAGSQSP